MLACDCDYGDDVAWWHDGPREPKPLATKRMRRCCSCKDRISVGDECVEFVRWHNPGEDSIEYRIYGEDVPLASWWMCERCAGLYESLDGLGFCNLLGQDLRSVCREYAQMQREAGVFRGQMVVRQAPSAEPCAPRCPRT
jgi:hypothetical protein